MDLPYEATPQSAIAWAETQDLPEGVSATKEWGSYIVRYKRNKPPWETYPSFYLYEGWGVNVAMLCAGVEFNVRDWINERHGLEYERTTTGAIEQMLDSEDADGRVTMQSREEARDE